MSYPYSYFYFDIKFGDRLPIFKREQARPDQARPGQARLHTGRNRFNLFQITFSTNTAEAHPGVSGVSEDQKF